MLSSIPQSKRLLRPPDPIIAASRTASAALIRFAREDPATFCEAILKDEETGDPIMTQPFQEEWHEALTKHRRVVIWTPPSFGKSQQLSIGRVLWELGRNPRRRFAILMATHESATKVIGAIRDHIERNTVLHQIFPEMRRGKLWQDTKITIDRPLGIKDPSVQVFSPESSGIQGARLDGLIIDDVLTALNTDTPYQRQKLTGWIRSSAFSRLSKGAWICVVCNAWHPDDFAHELAKAGWWHKKYPVYDEKHRPLWPDRWPQDRIDEQREIYGSPSEFARMMLCQARDESTARIKEAWINRALELGEGYRPYDSLSDIVENDPGLAREIGLDASMAAIGGMPKGFWTVTGVDLAISEKATSDLTALVTILLWPNGLRHLLEVQAGRWAGPEIIERIVGVHRRFGSDIAVETNGAQQYLYQWTRQQAPGMRIHSFTTGRNKLSPQYGVESIGGEIESGQWLFPCEETTRRVRPEVGDLIAELLHYDPRKHTGDRLMAMWIAREFARSLQLRGMAGGGSRQSARRGGVFVIGGSKSPN